MHILNVWSRLRLYPNMQYNLTSGGLFTNEKVIEQYPSVEYVAIACNFILSIISAYFILQLKTEDAAQQN